MTSIGDNSKELTEAERNSLFGYLVREHRANQLAIKAAKDKDAETMKKAKEWGFPKEEVTFFQKAREAGAGSAIVQKHSLHKKVLIKLGLIPDDRGGDLLTDRADRLQLIYAKGHSDGLAGEDCVSNYAGGSDEDRSYVDGWKAGQKEFAENWQRAMEKKLAAAKAKTNEEPPSDGDPFADDEAA